ncbi:hypothetical protein MIND_00204200 [Mycena indigotica]|uniref:Uncharacterized protein n=1 Tax=Mycena indigotica TaxID=2126181 RepID=A0A8H6WEJ8_9AGAR|nr:uncharacterized protein MIND_00204200 [Mycena indigotica]KAF7311928.1 hypothetical protein MIND_00204200 [Mycena indigotica]
MTSTAPPSPFRRRAIGRASSPPTWACYEQIREYADSDSDDEGSESGSDEEESGGSDGENGGDVVDDVHHDDEGMAAEMEMEVDPEAPSSPVPAAAEAEAEAAEMPPPTPAPVTAKAKGKQRAVEPEPPKRRTRKGKRERERVYTLRPILTIQRSQGFVWNQDLFVPPYIKDRYVASTSPPGNGFLSTSVSSTNSALTDYEIEVVEIRVQEGEFDGIIPQ